MGFSMFSPQVSPIAIDFGSASMKLLQITPGDRPRIVAATEIPLPESARNDPDKLTSFYNGALPAALSACNFKGKRAVMAIPSTRTLIQHMQIAEVSGARTEDILKGQLFAQMGCSPESVVVRSLKVGDVHRNSAGQSEMICFAIARDTVMRFVALLKRCKLNAVGVHTEAIAVVRAFDHLNRRADDANLTTMYVDLGWAGTGVAIAHGRSIVFARHIQLGGRHFDQHIASTLNCSIADAQRHRLAIDGPDFPGFERKRGESASALLDVAEQAQRKSKRRGRAAVAEIDRRSGDATPASCWDMPETDPPRTAAELDLNELLDTMTDELSMCLRYHQGLFAGRSVDRCIFVGGEARQLWLCQHVVKGLRFPAQLGDPLSRLAWDDTTETPGLKLGDPQPGWAVPYGLATAPTDL